MNCFLFSLFLLFASLKLHVFNLQREVWNERVNACVWNERVNVCVWNVCVTC